ncbi:hypothetical protein EDC04DRAFT_2887548 [Pisolithus marmoratus]|nr:hypothetical protein EDC04DRAFT_2887548 [Pisolithus marmoratus]
MFTKTFLSAAAAAALFVASASAICPGYKFGISQAGNNGPWQVFDGSCNVVHQVTAKNPCTVGVFDCNAAQTTPTNLHLNDHDYACVPDANPDSCNGQPIQVCVSLL